MCVATWIYGKTRDHAILSQAAQISLLGPCGASCLQRWSGGGLGREARSEEQEGYDDEEMRCLCFLVLVFLCGFRFVCLCLFVGY